jgi:hypothetical protein
MRLSAELSGGGGTSLLASGALIQPPPSNPNYFSVGIFSVVFSGAGETLTINLTADNQAGIPTDAPQYLFRNAGVFAATVNTAQVVPEPSSLVLGLAGGIGLAGLGLRKRHRRRLDPASKAGM